MEVNMTHAERLAEFVTRASYEDLSDVAVRELKILVLDSLGGAIGGESYATSQRRPKRSVPFSSSAPRTHRT
jgi:2-methylcitrate dehydratase PrpD